MKNISLILKRLGQFYIVLVCIVFFFGVVSIWLKEGFSKVQQIMSPFAIVEIIMVLIVSLPGLGLLYLGNKLKKKEQEKEALANKEYIRLAESVRDVNSSRTPLDPDALIDMFCRVLKKNNPNFDEKMFRQICRGEINPPKSPDEK